MIIKILTGGYNDVERGALDFAIERKISRGGWTPLGWLDKINRTHTIRGLQEVPHGGSPNYAERNILDADGTLLITEGEPIGAAELALNFAARYRHPLLHIDQGAGSQFQAAEAVVEWIAQNGIEVLNVTGGGPNPTIDLYQVTKALLHTAGNIGEVRKAMGHPGGQHGSRPAKPATIEEALDTLASLLPLEEKIRIGRTPPHDLAPLYDRLAAHIEKSLGWWINNDALANSCRSAAVGQRQERQSPDEILIRSLWQRFRRRYELRIVK